MTHWNILFALGVVIVNTVIDIIAVIAIVGLHRGAEEKPKEGEPPSTIAEPPPWRPQEPLVGLVIDREEYK